MENQNLKLSVGEFIALTNQTLEYAYPSIDIEGEVASFKVNQGKYVFFDLKDNEGTIGCFMMVFALRVPIEDGMKVVVTASPKLTQWGKFSLTVRAIRPSGEGALKKSFELLKKKLAGEGLFAPERKRPLPELPNHVAVVSSTQAAGYGDFIKILGERWGGLRVDVAHVQVQGEAAADQMIRALKHLNTQEVLPEVIVLLRGGGSADDLSAFNDELLVREIAASRVPVLTGIGHEIDESLADLAADRAASTPSNAAQLLVPDKREIIARANHMVQPIIPTLLAHVESTRGEYTAYLDRMEQLYSERHSSYERELALLGRMVEQFNPAAALARGYSVVRGEVAKGSSIEIEQLQRIITAEVTNVKNK
jgi:exodeoxyribonuclease VII large subunit